MYVILVRSYELELLDTSRTKGRTLILTPHGFEKTSATSAVPVNPLRRKVTWRGSTRLGQGVKSMRYLLLINKYLVLSVSSPQWVSGSAGRESGATPLRKATAPRIASVKVTHRTLETNLNKSFLVPITFALNL